MQMDLSHILILPLKILDETNGVLYHFLSTAHALNRFWDAIAVFKQL